jgi:CRISPR/Cas system CSM-associated protein Csm3 (group 7 of RAMP superfamily)
MKPTEEQNVYNNLRKMGLTDEEAKEVISADKAIDKGEKLFELTEEQKQAEKKYKNTHTRTVKTAYGQTQTKERKIDTDKRMLIDALVEKLENYADSGTVDITNAEREIELVFHNRKFKIVLSAPRK